MVAKAKALAAKAAAAKKAKEAKGEVLADCRRGHCGEEEQQLETSWLNAKKLAATLKAHAARVHAAARAMVAKAKALAAKAAAAAKKAKEAKEAKGPGGVIKKAKGGVAWTIPSEEDALMDVDEEEESDSQGSWFNTKKLAAIAKAHAARVHAAAAKAHAAAMAMVAKAKALAAKAAAAKKAKEAKGEVLADCRRGHCGEEEQQLETS